MWYERRKNLKFVVYVMDEKRGYLWFGEFLGRRKFGDENKRVYFGII